MGLFDSFLKKKSATNDVAVSGDNTEERQFDAQSPSETKENSVSAFGSMLKGGMSSVLKAVGIGGWKAKKVEGLEPNFSSEDPLDHVLAMNRASKAFGGLKNLGIYADVTKVTFSNALKVTTEDDYVEITTENREMPGNNIRSDESSAYPYDFSFDDLLTRDCPDLSGSRTPDSVIPYKA